MEDKLAEMLAAPDIKTVILGCELTLAQPPMSLNLHWLLDEFVKILIHKYMAHFNVVPDTGIFSMVDSRNDNDIEEEKFYIDYIHIMLKAYDTITVTDIEYWPTEEQVHYESLEFTTEVNPVETKTVTLHAFTPLHYYTTVIEKILAYARNELKERDPNASTDTEATPRVESENPQRERLVGPDAAKSFHYSKRFVLSMWRPQKPG